MFFLGCRYPNEVLKEVQQLSKIMEFSSQEFKTENVIGSDEPMKQESDVFYTIPLEKRIMLGKPITFILSKETNYVHKRKPGSIILPDETSTSSTSIVGTKCLRPRESLFLKSNPNATSQPFSLKFAESTPAKSTVWDSRHDNSILEIKAPARKQEINNLTKIEFKNQGTKRIRKPLKTSENHLQSTPEDQNNLSLLIHAIQAIPRSNYGSKAKIAVSGLQNELDFEIFSIKSLLQEFVDFLDSQSIRISSSRPKRDLTGHSYCCIVSFRGLELGFGLSHDRKLAKLEALLACDNVLQSRPVIISAQRLFGHRIAPQLCIFPTKDDQQGLNISNIGYLPPKPKQLDENKLKEISEITVFLHKYAIKCSISKIERIASLNGYTTNYVAEEVITSSQTAYKTKLYIGGLLIATGNEEISKKDSKRSCADFALEILMEKCDIIQERISENFKEVSVQDINSQVEKQADFSQDKGGSLMRLMGWKGGGIGKNESGRTEIVEVDINLCLNIDSEMIFSAQYGSNGLEPWRNWY